MAAAEPLISSQSSCGGLEEIFGHQHIDGQVGGERSKLVARVLHLLMVFAVIPTLLGDERQIGNRWVGEVKDLKATD